MWSVVTFQDVSYLCWVKNSQDECALYCHLYDMHEDEDVCEWMGEPNPNFIEAMEGSHV